MSIASFTDTSAAPTVDDQVLARSSSRSLAERTGLPSSLRLDVDGDIISIPSVAAPLILGMLKVLSEGQAATVLPIQTELTLQEAAEVLGSSDSFVSELLDSGTLAYRQSGNRKLILLGDLLAYEKERKHRRRETLAELTRQAQELNMGY